ncbi:MAG: HD domain-containing protein [Nanoarchaeota archaeon]|nr:HD domain-containing protein [Nanoarchaeota archaeon]
MKKVYNKILDKAIPYYEGGRSYDIPQIGWMLKEARKILKKINLREGLIFPIIILHDIGYSAVDEKNPNVKEIGTKKIHMEEGAKIAEQILRKLNYDKEFVEKIVYYISVHDNWVLGDDEPFKECKEMALFNDLDFLVGIRSKEMFDLRAESMEIAPSEMFNSLLKEEKLKRRPFCCKETKELFSQLMGDRKKEL